MKRLKFHNSSSRLDIWAGVFGLALGILPAWGADFAVRTPNSQFAFQINGVNSPTLTLVRGQTYTFDVQTTAGFHPFHIESPGVSPNNISSGTMTYIVPASAANYFYNCSFHGNTMRGEIVTVPPPAPADFMVRTPGDQLAFQINGVNSPTLTLVRGRTYTFDVHTSTNFHPFHIESPGVDTNDIDFGTITYTVPMDATNYFYDCIVHFTQMRGQIVTVAPPAFRIVSLSVSSNIVLRSTGTNTWTVNPEFNTNLTTANWFALTVQSNRFMNGTNEIFCGRPPGSNVFIRLRAQPNGP